jgi:Cof subfamily protein (haloacid dehalogenase superfamily)
MPVRLIVADLDGTLLDSAHRVSPLTAQAIRVARARGILFTVATGKTFPSTQEWIRRFDIQLPVICANGTLIHAPDGTVLHEDPIPREYAIEAVRLARKAGVMPVIYAGHGLLAPEWNVNIDVLIEHHEPAPEIIPDLESALAGDHKPHKLIMINADDLDAVAALQETLADTFAGRAQVLRTGLDSVVEVLPHGVTKGTALAFVLDHLGLSAQDTIAFGDNCNDLDMIQRAGIGVAMGHAPAAVCEGADYITGTNNEDGVGTALHRFVLDTITD